MKRQGLEACSSTSRKLTTGEADEKGKLPNLLGAIVEKGFSTTSRSSQDKLAPTSFPRPTVLPFPVARHRSHGPQWAPLKSQPDEEDDHEDSDATNFDPIAAFASPVPRKQKKELDFSKWKEFVASDSLPVRQERKGNQILSAKHGVGNREYALPEKEENLKLNATTIPTRWSILENVSQKEHTQFHVATSSNKTEETAQSHSPFMNDIDAENQAILENMSADEIAEAQSEIMAKIRPEILEMLKKRGQNKLKKAKSLKLLAKPGEKPELLFDKNGSNSGLGTAHTITLPPQQEVDRTSTVAAKTNMLKKSLVADGKGYLPFGGSNCSTLWKAWTDRVEAVRFLRFSLDGSLVRIESGQPFMTGTILENVTERDFLRMEGDPGGVGYTIKEAVELIRSTVPGQRAFALQLLESVLDKALCNLQQNQASYSVENANSTEECIDWQAIWAFALGPEPGLMLSLRMALDDNHISVVLACLKVIQSILCCNGHEDYFKISEKLITFSSGIYTAPVFRSKPDVTHGFLRGGYWKYSTKPSNIVPFSDHKEEENKEELEDDEEKHTIQDDIIVAGQDVTAGLVRMSLLPRICYLIEMVPVSEETLLSILIGVARHSRSCADAIIKCRGLTEAIVNQVFKKDPPNTCRSVLKSVTLLKVLAQNHKESCVYFVKSGIFQIAMQHLYKVGFSVDDRMKLGLAQDELTCALIREQLSFWKICIQYGHCLSYFSDFFPAMCIWLSPPSEKLAEHKSYLLSYTSVARETYVTLEALAGRLPILHSKEQLQDKTASDVENEEESWSWSHVAPMVESARNWLSFEDNPYLLLLSSQNCEITDGISSTFSCILWVISAVLKMLSSVVEKTAPGLSVGNTTCVPWLPEFIPQIGLDIVKNGFLDFRGTGCMEHGRLFAGKNSVIKSLCQLRHSKDIETSLSAVSCLHGLVQLIFSLDKAILRARFDGGTPLEHPLDFSSADKIVENGIAMSYQSELEGLQLEFMTLIGLEWPNVQCIEMFGRGGPAPGPGLGWGAPGGGFWSMATLLAETDAYLVVSLLKNFPTTHDKYQSPLHDMHFNLIAVNSALSACLTLGPRSAAILDKALEFLVRSPVLQYLGFCIEHFLCLNGRKPFEWSCKDLDYFTFSKLLYFHYKSRWLQKKKKSGKKICKQAGSTERSGLEKGEGLETIYEEVDPAEVCNPENSLMEAWAYQRLPLPLHWFLSAMSTTRDDKVIDSFPNASDSENHLGSSSDILGTAKAGLFFLLGVEALSSLLQADVVCSPVLGVPLVWKLHALSMVLLVNTDFFDDERIRDIYRTLQELYGQALDNDIVKGKMDSSLTETRKQHGVEFLKFMTDVHDSYPTFLEIFIEQFSAVSYGDLMYARQVALYLHQCVEAPVRLAAWSTLSSFHVFELLPPIGECFGDASGYLNPLEENMDILEAYVKSWISGSLDRAVIRGSMSWTLALHHLSSFIFLNWSNDKLSLRKKLARFLIRDSLNKKQHEDMFLKLIQYSSEMSLVHGRSKDSSMPQDKIQRRFNFLSEACEGNYPLLVQIEKLQSSK